MQNKTLERILRVDHAGEYGAVRIYAGQLAVLKNNPHIQHMARQEADHLKKFNQLLVEHKVRPTVFQPVWHVAAYALGAVTALMGEKAAHACTIAVETVIDDHYQNQLDQLQGREDCQDIQQVIHHCHQEELEHRQMAIEQGGEGAAGFQTLTTAVKAISKAAIWLSSRV
ncbi:demethoxyubiquinone hydroxylase family protein [Candidatus Finniella inopinata]|uniref:3-demethoxyubiquinol 3-hydroxylase n=1 Tax=Candidatus Finniella inopinata TaxID=1696036 RepID=A0A4Q7DJD4_9PROT|nr:demethoxyubiquinone hydroxylase family protein [Candidatus Finniella inopinata]RZI47111.1 demethoxyubiquinone hydroxylase family protein [Candidatus Finniella inopinata]